MKYRVIIEDPAHEDLEANTLWLAQHSEEAAKEWYWQVRKAIESLDRFPLRCPLAPEDEAFDEKIRHLLHGRRRYVYRILFTVRDRTVHILHIRHGASEPMKPEAREP